MKKKNLLVTGKPGSGKTTIVEKILETLGEHNPRGFLTKEIRKGGNRAGFELVSLEGRRAVLSHVDIRSRYRVGKYGVDLESFEAFLDELSLFEPGTGLVVIDEIGKMECLSVKFCTLLNRVLDSPIPLLATIARSGPDILENIKGREDVVLMEIKKETREPDADILSRKVGEMLTG